MLLGALPLQGQCGNSWQSAGGLPGVHTPYVPGASQWSISDSVMWDPDGPGPQTARLVLAGKFTIAGNVMSSGVVTFDPATGQWQALGSGGPSGAFYTLAVLPNGDLVRGGALAMTGGSVAEKVARWNGVQWVSIGAPPLNWVGALAVLPNGDLVAAGSPHVARWDGVAWTVISPSVSPVYCMRVMSTGDLMVGGGFDLGRWDGSAWTWLGNYDVHALAELPDGSLAAGGGFDLLHGGPGDRIAIWNGTWTGVGGGLGSPTTLPIYQVMALVVSANGDLIVGGYFDLAGGGVPASGIARWDGSAWHPMLAGSAGRVSTLTYLPNGDLVAGGRFDHLEGTGPDVARWDGTSWRCLGAGLPASVLALAVLPNGHYVAGGEFLHADGNRVNHIAEWDGSQWSAMGNGKEYGDVRSLLALPGGDIIAGGVGFGQPDDMARWNGVGWQPMGSFPGFVDALALLPNGDIVAGGTFTQAGGTSATNIARWNGSVWSELGGGVDGPVLALAALPNGELIVGGHFTTAGVVSAGGIARWDGTEWAALDADIMAVEALVMPAMGDLFAAGIWRTGPQAGANCVARWNGVAWSLVGTTSGGSVKALAVRANGDLLAAGDFILIDGVPAYRLARWDGNVWHAVGFGFDGEVAALAARSDGEVMAGGDFRVVGGSVSAFVARLPLCAGVPALATEYGYRCNPTFGAYAETFPSGDFDLGGSATVATVIRHVPIANGYEVGPGVSAWFSPTSPDLALADEEGSGPISLPFLFPYPGGATTEVEMVSNGYLWLDGVTGLVEYFPQVEALVTEPARLAPLWMDLDPTMGGSCHYDVDPSGSIVYFTWDGVPHYNGPGPNTFQIALHSNGLVEYRYLEITGQLDVCLVGRNRGVGSIPPETDISAGMPFEVTVDAMGLAFTATTRPVLGTVQTAMLADVPDPASSIGLVLLGFSHVFPGGDLAGIGAQGCQLYPAVDLIDVLFPLGASTPWNLAIPSTPALANLEIHAQGAVLEPRGANMLRLLTSNGIGLRIGTF
ncbi:MAG: hypothetical protein K8J09_14765 [Planctomycetes bacterium]|nr:hypothetical protein [Planctomycetota bacterium]